MLESHNSLSTGLLWLLLSRGFRMGGEAGSNDQCSVEMGPALQDILSPLHFKKAVSDESFDDIELINRWRRNIGSVFYIKCLSSFKMIMTMCVYEIL